MFDAEVVDAVDDRQRAFLDALREMIRRLAPAEMDLPTTTATIEAGLLFVPSAPVSGRPVPGRERGPDEAVVYFGVEHEHFWPGDPVNGRLWPINASDLVTAAFELVEAILVGRAELEVRDGVVMQRATSYLVDNEGKRTVITRSGTFRLRRGPAAENLVRFDFGATRS